MTNSAAKNMANSAVTIPEVKAEDKIENIKQTFFLYDCVHIRGLLNPKKLSFFYDICARIYAKDDADFNAGRREDADWLHEYTAGWIWEDRLRNETNGAFGYQDITVTKKLYDILGAIIGNSWIHTKASQIRRIAALRDKNWGSNTNYHLDAQWGIDHKYILNVWTPFVKCGRTAPGLEYILVPASEMRAYSKYDPSISLDPPGPHGISPRMDYNLFTKDMIKKNFSADRFWVPDMELGDVVIFSNWCAHYTWVTPDMSQDRISLEWRVRLDTFDTPMRPAAN